MLFENGSKDDTILAAIAFFVLSMFFLDWQIRLKVSHECNDEEDSSQRVKSTKDVGGNLERVLQNILHHKYLSKVLKES